VDANSSMHFGTRRVTKYALGIEFAALAARIVTRHGDKIGALAVSSAGLKPIPAGSGRSQALRMLTELWKLQDAPIEPPKPHHLGEALEMASKTLRRRGLVFVVSDFLESPEHWQPMLSKLGLKHDVVCLRTLDPVERELPQVGGARFRDPATNQEIWIDTADKNVRAEHTKMVAEREERIQKAFRRSAVDHFELVTAHDILQPMLKFCLRRKGRRS
jgi:uncharacterized protein (DUF58 family)